MEILSLVTMHDQPVEEEVAELPKPEFSKNEAPKKEAKA
jgi:hypothetical protein